MKRQKGFSLLELLIVVAIILIIATIAIPSLLRSRQSANETNAVASLRSLNTAQVQYLSSHQGQYGTMGVLIAEGLLDERFSTGAAGYDFTIQTSAPYGDYLAIAVARGASSGRYDYYTQPDYVIRYATLTSRAPLGLAGEPVR